MQEVMGSTPIGSTTLFTFLDTSEHLSLAKRNIHEVKIQTYTFVFLPVVSGMYFSKMCEVLGWGLLVDWRGPSEELTKEM